MHINHYNKFALWGSLATKITSQSDQFTMTCKPFLQLGAYLDHCVGIPSSDWSDCDHAMPCLCHCHPVGVWTSMPGGMGMMVTGPG